MMETEQRSTQRWERLRKAAERNDPCDRLEHDAGDDDLEGREEALVSRWRWLKAVSMVVFSGQSYKTVKVCSLASAHPFVSQIEPPLQPEMSESRDLLAAAETDLGANRPQPATTAQVQASLSPRQAAKLRSNNPVPQVVMDVVSDLPRSTETAQVQNVLSPRHTAKLGRNNSVRDIVMDVASTNPPRSTETTAPAAQVAAVNVPTVDQMKKEQQGRCLKYSQKALSFAICTLIGYASAISLEPTDDNKGTKGTTTFKLAIAPFFVAICTDLFSLKTKAKLGNVLVYISSFHLVLMVYFIFISFNNDYAYAILFLPLVAGVSLLQQKIWPEGHRQITDEKLSKDLDSMFELSSLILNWSTFISAIMAIFRDLIKGPNEFIHFSPVGFLFLLTIILGLYLMLVTTVRTAALNLRVKYLDVLLICLLVSTLIAALIAFGKKE
ncbi:hypothetical protein HU200_056168 [Digitaria exilis]|uniref:Uncharacterized protein n=1 Tax=Digitaria exilis TaxID=1010633 RepID=A0A835AEG6_9POAL|nr:hypothetical protein HU200_056168 [Digitaria exilis]CAB3480321.1 unnamed protein product [Digitaria exilis]